MKNQPTAPAQTCAVTAGSGLVVGGPVTTPTVACVTNTYAVGGTVSGLTGSGLVLRLNGGGDLAVGASGAFAFAGRVEAGRTFEVSVAAQPSAPWQACAVAGGSGTVVAGDVTGVAVVCATQAYAVGGNVTGLEGSGLTLQQSGGDDLAVSARGGFAFATPVASGAAYAVTVTAQPTAPWQTCGVTAGTGSVAAAPVTDVTVSCLTDSFAIGGTVTGLAGGQVILGNGADTVTVSGDGSFVLPAVASGASYAVGVRAQPTGPSQTCSVSQGSGVVAGAPVTSVDVTCVTSLFSVGGTATGMPPAGLQLGNGLDLIVLDFDGPYAFPTLGGERRELRGDGGGPATHAPVLGGRWRRHGGRPGRHHGRRQLHLRGRPGGLRWEPGQRLRGGPEHQRRELRRLRQRLHRRGRLRRRVLRANLGRATHQRVRNGGECFPPGPDACIPAPMKTLTELSGVTLRQAAAAIAAVKRSLPREEEAAVVPAVVVSTPGEPPPASAEGEVEAVEATATAAAPSAPPAAAAPAAPAEEAESEAVKAALDEAVSKATGVSGDRLSRLREAVQVVGRNIDDVRLVRVFGPEEPVPGARTVGGFQYLVDVAPASMRQVPSSQKKERGRGGGGGGGRGGAGGGGGGGGKGAPTSGGFSMDSLKEDRKGQRSGPGGGRGRPGAGRPGGKPGGGSPK